MSHKKVVILINICKVAQEIIDLTNIPLEKITSISLNEVYSEKIEERPIIRDFLYEGDQTVIYAPSGVGKSLIVQDVAMSMGCGSKSLWEIFDIPKPRVTLFIQSENSRAAIYQRTRKKCDGQPDFVRGLQNVIYASSSANIQLAGHVTDKSFRSQIIENAKSAEFENDLKIDLIVFDPLISYHDAEENDNSRMRTTLDFILEVTNKITATPVIIHHANKDHGLRGATAIADWARNIIKLEDVSKGGEKRIKFTHEKCNNAKMLGPFILVMDDHLNFSPLDVVASISSKERQRGLQVKEALELIGGESETKSRLCGMSANLIIGIYDICNFR